MVRQTRGIKYAVGLSFIVAAMIAVFAVANVSAQEDYSSGMVGYWKFNGTLIDESGIYNATIGAYGSYADGTINQGLHDATGCSDLFAARVDNFPSSDSFTIEAWIKPACPPESCQYSLTVTKLKETGNSQSIGFMFLTILAML